MMLYNTLSCPTLYCNNSGDGVGDGPHSWAFDGWRRYRWHGAHARWGAHWAKGDVVGKLSVFCCTFTGLVCCLNVCW
jgi:hypothetical protein